MFRSKKSLRGLVAVAGVAALTLSACGTTSDDDGNASGDCAVKLAFLGPTSGDYANLGINIVNGAKLALQEYNANDPDCDVTIEEFDSQGDPEKAKPLANQIGKDGDFVGVIGPTFSGESEATGPIFSNEEILLPTISASATNPDLTTFGWDTFQRIIGTDALQAPAAAKFITETLGKSKVLVVDDASEYGAGFAKGVQKALGDAVVDTDTVQQKQDNFSATVTKAKGRGADAVFFAGYYTEAGKLAKQLKDNGFTGSFISGDGSLDPGFITNAGSAANGSYLTCPCAWGVGEWAEKYEELTGQGPGTYSTEGYDVANIFLQGIAEGNTTRADLLEWINSYEGEGITKPLKFTEQGDIEESDVYSYEITDGTIPAGKVIE